MAEYERNVHELVAALSATPVAAVPIWFTYAPGYYPVRDLHRRPIIYVDQFPYIFLGDVTGITPELLVQLHHYLQTHLVTTKLYTDVTIGYFNKYLQYFPMVGSPPLLPADVDYNTTPFYDVLSVVPIDFRTRTMLTTMTSKAMTAQFVKPSPTGSCSSSTLLTSDQTPPPTRTSVELVCASHTGYDDEITRIEIPTQDLPEADAVNKRRWLYILQLAHKLIGSCGVVPIFDSDVWTYISGVCESEAVAARLAIYGFIIEFEITPELIVRYTQPKAVKPSTPHSDSDDDIDSDHENQNNSDYEDEVSGDEDVPEFGLYPESEDEDLDYAWTGGVRWQLDDYVSKCHYKNIYTCLSKLIPFATDNYYVCFNEDHTRKMKNHYSLSDLETLRQRGYYYHDTVCITKWTQKVYRNQTGTGEQPEVVKVLNRYPHPWLPGRYRDTLPLDAQKSIMTTYPYSFSDPRLLDLIMDDDSLSWLTKANALICYCDWRCVQRDIGLYSFGFRPLISINDRGVPEFIGKIMKCRHKYQGLHPFIDTILQYKLCMVYGRDLKVLFKQQALIVAPHVVALQTTKFIYNEMYRCENDVVQNFLFDIVNRNDVDIDTSSKLYEATIVSCYYTSRSSKDPLPSFSRLPYSTVRGETMFFVEPYMLSYFDVRADRYGKS